MPAGDKKPQKRKKAIGQTHEEKRKLCFEYFRQGQFNKSVISKATKIDRHTISGYEDAYLESIRSNSSFIQREQNARDGLVLYLENYIAKAEGRASQIQEIIEKGLGGKNVGIMLASIANIERDIKETTKEIAALNMTPLTDDMIETEIAKKYDLKLSQLKKPET